MTKKVVTAAYGKQILATVSRELTNEFGGGFGYATVNRAIQFSQFFPDPAIVSTLSTQSSRSHFIERLTIKGSQQPLRTPLHQTIDPAGEMSGGAAR